MLQTRKHLQQQQINIQREGAFFKEIYRVEVKRGKNAEGKFLMNYQKCN